MKEVALQFVTCHEKQKEISDRLTSIRKIKRISRERLSVLSGVPYASIRRFESTGEISFASLIKIAIALRLYDDLDNLFKVSTHYQSIEDVLRDQ